jgi:hypothetical protein
MAKVDIIFKYNSNRSQIEAIIPDYYGGRASYILAVDKTMDMDKFFEMLVLHKFNNIYKVDKKTALRLFKETGFVESWTKELAKKYSEMFDRISLGYSGEYFD